MITELLGINLVDALGLSALPASERDALLEEMTDIVEQRVNLEVLMRLSEEDKKELDTLLDANQDILPFLRNKISNLDILVAETIASFKKEMLDMQAMVKKHRAEAN